MREDLAESEFKAHADDCEVCYVVLLHLERFDDHADNCAICSNLSVNKDYCPVGLSLQESWLDALYIGGETPKCIEGDTLLDAYLDDDDDEVWESP